MRIGIITGIYPPIIGGPATHAKKLSEKLLHFGHKVNVITLGLNDRQKEIRRDGRLCIYRIPNFEFIKIRPLILLFKLLSMCIVLFIILKREKIDLLQVYGQSLTGIPSRIVNKIFHKPSVIRLVGEWGQQTYSLQKILRKIPNLTKLLFKTQRWVLNGFNKVIVPGNHALKIATNLGISREKVKIIPNAIELPNFLNKLEKKDAKKLLKLQGRIILTVGRLVPIKGFKYLILAFSEISKTFPDAKLFIIGEGPLKQSLNNLVSSLELEKNVVFAGRLNHHLVLLHMYASDVFVLPSILESFPNVIMEAMVCKVPVISTKTEGARTLIKANETGLLVELRSPSSIIDAINYIFTKEEEVNNMCKRAFAEITNKFLWNKVMMEFLQLYESMIKSG